MSKVVKQAILNPLDSHDFILVLVSFSDLFRSSIGPRGKLKIIITGGGYSIVTSSSRRLVNNIVIDNPICIFISQLIKSQLADYKDCGLYMGIVLSNLLAQSLTQQRLPHNIASSFLQQITSDLIYIINSFKINIDFSTVKHLLPLIKTILSSKPACCLPSNDVDHLAIVIVKAFLNSVCEDLGDVNVICAECCGLDKAIVFAGCLYQTNDDTCNLNMNILTRNSHKEFMIVFNIMLTEEKLPKQSHVDRVTLELGCEKSFQIAKAMEVLEIVVSLGVGIVACQKVVHPWLKLYLQRNGVLLLDRMGTEITKHVVDISGAVPISDLAGFESGMDLEPFLGHVNSVQPVTWGGKTYLALEREDRNVSTLLVRAANPEAAEELKITIQQALSSLKHLLVAPFLIPGSGCSEMVMAASMHYLVLQKQDKEKYVQPLSQLQACIRWLQISLLSAAGLHNELVNLSVDLAYFHAWDVVANEDWSKCRCGLITAAMVMDKNEGWRGLDITSGILFPECKEPHYATSTEITENVNIDLYGSKFNALKLALESCVGLLGIGMVLTRHDS